MTAKLILYYYHQEFHFANLFYVNNLNVHPSLILTFAATKYHKCCFAQDEQEVFDIKPISF